MLAIKTGAGYSKKWRNDGNSNLLKISPSFDTELENAKIYNELGPALFDKSKLEEKHGYKAKIITVKLVEGEEQ